MADAKIFRSSSSLPSSSSLRGSSRSSFCESSLWTTALERRLKLIKSYFLGLSLLVFTRPCFRLISLFSASGAWARTALTIRTLYLLQAYQGWSRPWRGWLVEGDRLERLRLRQRWSWWRRCRRSSGRPHSPKSSFRSWKLLDLTYMWNIAATGSDESSRGRFIPVLTGSTS